MAVYVDNMRAPFGRMIMCHMIADTTEELDKMALRIGVPRKWCQGRGTPREHFDICQSKRKLAVEHGAIELSQRQLGIKMIVRRLEKVLAPPTDFQLK